MVLCKIKTNPILQALIEELGPVIGANKIFPKLLYILTISENMRNGLLLRVASRKSTKISHVSSKSKLACG